MIVSFFVPMKKIPTMTHQQKDITVKGGKPIVYESAELKAVRAKYEAYLAGHVPDRMLRGPLRLITKWCFPLSGKHRDGEYKTTKPDTDNLVKMVKDVMTDLHYWRDDAQVASEVIEKFWASLPGLYIYIEELSDDG
jgi:Holliday junction resolvase RusA-like endonuclease